MHPCVAMLVQAHVSESLSIPWSLRIHVARDTDRLPLSCFTTAIVRLSVHCLSVSLRGGVERGQLGGNSEKGM
jgi:hypothetical protein